MIALLSALEHAEVFASSADACCALPGQTALYLITLQHRLKRCSQHASECIQCWLDDILRSSSQMRCPARPHSVPHTKTITTPICAHVQSQRSSSVALQAQASFDHSANSSHQTPAPTPDATSTADNPTQPEANSATQPAVPSHAQTDSSEGQQPSADGSQGQESDGAAAHQSRKSQDGGVDEGEAEQQPADNEANDGRTAHLASLAEQADIR